MASRSWPLPSVPDFKPLIVKAHYDYKPVPTKDHPEEADRLQLKKGDLLEIIEPSELKNNTWWLAKHQDSGLQGYVPSNFVRCLEPNSEGWWFSVDRAKAEQLLSREGYPKGTFLVRPSSKETSYALSVRDFGPSDPPGHIRHYMIDVANNGTCSPHEYPHIRFETVANLVAYFNGNNEGLCHKLAMPCPQSDQVWIDHLVAKDDIDYIPNLDPFECPICYDEFGTLRGVMLRGCYHTVCTGCLSGHVKACDTATVKCPYPDCDTEMEQREIRAVVDEPEFLQHLSRGLKIAEAQAPNSFHCKTPDCPGWCFFDPGAPTFKCDVCKKTNCINCKAIHTGQNCRQYQDDLKRKALNDKSAMAGQNAIEALLKSGDAMRCPCCEIIVQKMEGCDWLKCAMCQTEICWVTKGARWGPKGHGDTSGGCKCGVGGKRCHPNCGFCH